MHPDEIAALIHEFGFAEAFKIYQERKREREAIEGERQEAMPWEKQEDRKP